MVDPVGDRRSAGRLPELDGVRGLAILLVLAHHYCLNLPVGGWGDQQVLRITGMGWIGVDLFFLLSGYLITGILLDGKRSPGILAAFYARRALRIFPPYYLLLFGLFVVGPAFGVSLVGSSASDAIWFWLYGSNFLIALTDWPHRILAPLWSLAVEEHFYLIWPLVVLAVPTRRLKATLIVIALGSAVLRLVGVSMGLSHSAIYVLTFTRLDALAVGGLLAAAQRSPGWGGPWLTSWGGAAFMSALLLGAPTVVSNRGHWGAWAPAELVTGFLLLAIGLGGALAWLLGQGPTHWARVAFRSRGLTHAGRRSYGLYLYHMPLIEIVGRLGLDLPSLAHAEGPHWPILLGYLPVQGALLFLVAEVSWRLMERPLLRLKDRLPYR